jgi:hypothetical protein
MYNGFGAIAPPNNSFNASGNSSTFIDNLDVSLNASRRVNSGVGLLTSSNALFLKDVVA